MSPARMFSVALVASIVAAGCDDPTTAPALEADTVGDLSFVLPDLTREHRMDAEIIEIEPPERPAGAFSDNPGPPPVQPFGQILSASTNVGFTPTYAYSAGRHTYTGNAGRVETEARVTFEGQTIGRQPQSTQNYVPYLFDWGAAKTISTEAYVFIDQDCGLKVDGSSEHRAWWEWFLGGPAPSWGHVSRTTQAFPPMQQPTCSEIEEPNPPGGGSNDDGGNDGDGPVTCWYWVTYDPYTGEIYDAQYLYCDDVEGG